MTRRDAVRRGVVFHLSIWEKIEVGRSVIATALRQRRETNREEERTTRFSRPLRQVLHESGKEVVGQVGELFVYFLQRKVK